MKCATVAVFLTLGLASFGASPVVPRPAKDFTVVEPSGRQIKLSSLKGKVVSIEFLFTTCPHCQAASKVFTQLQQELGPKGFQALGVAFDEATAEKTARFKQQFGVGYPVGFATQDVVMNYLGISVMERMTVPQVMIIDRKGQVRAQSEPLGTEQLSDLKYLRTMIGDLLKESGSPRSSAKKAAVTAAVK